jgi:hypothetical protein
VIDGEAIEEFAPKIFQETPTDGMGLREAPMMSAPALDLVPPVILGLREGDGAMADNGRQHTVGRRLRLSRW